jgi:hypothetical protein
VGHANREEGGAVDWVARLGAQAMPHISQCSFHAMFISFLPMQQKCSIAILFLVANYTMRSFFANSEARPNDECETEEWGSDLVQF